MSGARCCCTPGDPSCCEQAGGSWWNRYCLYLEASTYYHQYCDCSTCTQGCDDCTTAMEYCCQEEQFDFCVRGALFRRPFTDGLCEPDQSDYTYRTCPDPWVAPDWGPQEGGVNSFYASPIDNLLIPPWSECDLCSVAPVAARIRYQCRYRLEHVEGSGCTDEEFDEAYVVEGKATLYCTTSGCSAAEGAERDLDCDCAGVTWPEPAFILKIESCESPASGLPAPPTLWYYASLDNKTPPHLATWTLGMLEWASPSGYDSQDYCNPIEAYGSFGVCADPEVGQGCVGYSGGESWGMGELNFYTYPCQDQDCTL